MPVASGRNVLQQFKQALGFGDVPLQKLVIEIDVNNAVRVYAKGLAKDAHMNAACELLRLIRVDDVQVSDDCTVTYQEEKG